MNALHGFPITAGELGRRLAEGGPDALLRLVNGLLAAWAANDGPGIQLRLNEIPYLPDGGVDAVAVLPRPLGELPQGRIVFQLKWRDVLRKPEKTMWGDLGRKIDAEIQRLLKREDKPPAAYVLVTNVRLGEADQKTFMKSRSELNRDLPESFFHLWEASRLLSELQAHPQIAFWIFGGPSALSLHEALSTMYRRTALRHLPWPTKFVGRQKATQSIKEATRGKAGGRLVIHGPAGVGATRLLLESLRPYEGRVVWFDGTLPSDQDLRLLSGSTRAILAFDQPPDLEALTRLMTGPARLSMIAAVSGMTLPRDLRPLTVELCDLAHEEMSNLLDSLVTLPDNTPLHPDFLEKSWIEHNAEGRPGLAVALAAVAFTEANDGKSAPLEAWIERLEHGLTERERLLLDTIAALGPIGAREERARELTAALGISGNLLSSFEEILRTLEQRGLLVFHGRLAKVSPGVLEEFCAARWLSGHPSGVARLVLELDDGLQRLLRLLVRARASSRAVEVTRELLEMRFPNLKRVVAAAEEYWQIASVIPDEALQRLEELLDANSDSLVKELRGKRTSPPPLTDEQLLEAAELNSRAGDPLRELASLCQEVVCRGVEVRSQDTPLRALRLLANLATTSVKLNRPEHQAVSAFSEAMVPFHPEVAVGLTERHALLKELTTAHDPADRRVALETLVAIFEAESLFSFNYHSGASRVPVKAVRITWHDVWRYHADIRPLVTELLLNRDGLPIERLGELARAAILSFGRSGKAEAVDAIVKAVEAAFPITPATVNVRKQALSALEILSAESRGGERGQLDELQKSLRPKKAAPFNQRLVWLLSEPTWDQRREAAHEGTAQPDQAGAAIKKLVGQVMGKPDLLDPALEPWLLQDASFGHLFCRYFGTEEARRKKGSRLAERYLFEKPATKRRAIEPSRAWGAYLVAWCSTVVDRARAELLLERVLDAGHLEIAAQVMFSIDPQTLDWRKLWARMRKYAQSSKPESVEVVRRAIFFSRWAQDLSQSSLVTILSDLLQAGAAPLNLVNVLWARSDKLEPCSLQFALEAMQRWTESLSDRVSIDDVLSIEQILRAVAEQLTDEYVAWFLDTVKKIVGIRMIGLPSDAQIVLHRLMNLVQTKVPDMAVRLLDTLAEASRRPPGIIIGFSPAVEPLIDSERDRDAILQLARKNPKGLARILDEVVQPPDSLMVKATTDARGEEPEATLARRERRFFDLLRDIIQASRYDVAILQAVEQGFSRLLLSSSTEQLAQQACSELKDWESSPDERLRSWAARYRSHYEQQLRKQMSWDAESLFWDSNLNLDDARQILNRDRKDSRRRWLVRRIMRDIPFDEAVRLLNPQDVEAELDAMEDLSPAKQRMWEKWFRDYSPVS